MAIINIRGTNGSGKTTCARNLLGGQEYQRGSLGLTGVTVNITAGGIAVIGKYSNACGGCDGIKTQDLICEAVREASQQFEHVVFEGMLVSTLFKRYADLSTELPGGIVFAYLDTPLLVCLSRIQQRNGGKPINEQLVADKVRAIESTRLKFMDGGFKVAMLDYKNPMPRLRELLEQ